MRYRLHFCAALLAATAASAQDHNPEKEDYKVFSRVFGMARVIPAEIMEQVKALEPGGRLELDTNGDGVVETLWYFDTDKRHTIQPMLVCAVDEDGDLAVNGRPDRDSDCYFWDHEADGHIDVVTDYVDDDGDNDVDQMGIFYDKNWRDDIDDLTVWWAVDIGDDNLLWYDVNGTYYQPLCQWRTHFSGDELFYQFRLTEDDENWVNVWEDPFAFYDPDGDRCSEMVIRISAIGDDVKNLRYSIDADDDAWGENTHNYDFSVTALPAEEGLVTTEWNGAPLTIRGIDTLPLLSWEDTPAFAQQAKWGSAMLTWDEINSNTDEKPEQDPHERWEGILNHASKHGDFEQVGGPPSSAFNKRVEVSHAPASPLRLYWDASDKRYHLLGAAYGYMDVDYNFDGVLDAAYTWTDTDGDGVLDKKEADVDADGTVDITWTLSGIEKEVPLTFEAFKDEWRVALGDAVEEDAYVIDVAFASINEVPESFTDVLTYISGPLENYHRETGIGAGIRSTLAGNRFYFDLLRDRAYVALRGALHAEDKWKEASASFTAGDIGAFGVLMNESFGLSPEVGRTKRPVAEPQFDVITQNLLHNSVAPFASSMPLSLPLEAVRSDHFAVLDTRYWISNRLLPHQVDSWDFDGEPTVHYIADIEKGESQQTAIGRLAEDAPAPEFPKLTNAVLDNPAYVAWESDAGAYRFYTGQFDFFGKQVQLLPREERLIFPLIDVNYHAQQDWGIDALHVGKTSGLGGLTLYVDGEAYLVQSPAGEGDVEFEYEVLGSGPIRAAVEIRAKNVVPKYPDAVVRIRCYIYAGHEESEIVVQLPDELKGAKVAPGLMDLEEGVPFEDVGAGMLGVWGYQGDDIGEIGLGVVVPPGALEEIADVGHERRAICTPAENGQFRYWIVGGWRRGMQYPVSADGQTWREYMEGLAAQVMEAYSARGL